MWGWSDQRRSGLCFLLVFLTLGWAVFAWGTAQDFVIQGEVVVPPEGDPIFLPNKLIPIRTIAFCATGVVALACFFLLPGRDLKPRVPWPLGAAVGFLLVYGWFLTGNSASNFDGEGRVFVEIKRALGMAWAPGSVARSDSVYAMIELSLVAMALLVAVKSSERSAWRGLFALIAIFGGLVAMVGLYHKAAGLSTTYGLWSDDKQSHLLFAPYYYNANAGAFMNLCLPIAMGLGFSSVGDERKRARGIVWFVVAAVTMAGVVVAASKGAIIILAAIVPIFVLWNLRRVRLLIRNFRVQRGRKAERMLIAISFVVMVLILTAIGITLVVKRWDDFLARFSEPSKVDITGRTGIIKLMLRMVEPGEGGWHGYGPGTFQHLVPYFNTQESGATEELSAGDWSLGHCDPLQTVVEWGWVGGAAWFVIGIGAVVSGALLLRHKNWLSSSDDVPLVRGAILALVMVGIHSCQDFPLSIYSIHLIAMLLCGACWGLYYHRRRLVRARRGRTP